MKLDVILSLVAPVILASAYIMLWRARKVFPPSGLILIGLAIMIVARFSDAFIENLDVLTLNPAQNRQMWIMMHLDFFADSLDAVGAVLLVSGFIRTIRYQTDERRHIHTLETLLPICATCKRIRNADNTWDTIEEYLEKSGSPPLTHGICPSCRNDLVDTYNRKKATEGVTRE